MEYQKYMPEGWNLSGFDVTKEQLTNALLLEKFYRLEWINVIQIIICM